MRKKVDILLPWNLPEYCASNGFHDLYDFMLEDKKCNLQTINLARFCGKKYLKFLSYLNKFDPEFKDYKSSVSVSYLLNKIAAAGCKIEFMHTSPIFASRKKPFFFHLEDFQSIFLHRDILQVFKEDVDLKKIFEYDSCLGIVSHIPETLQSFRNYFQSPIIDSKLYYSKIALSKGFAKSADRIKEMRREDDETVFLFTSSGHQHTNNYATRGLKVVINVAKKLLDSGHKVKFIFKCVKLSRPDFLFIGLSEEQIDFVQNCPSIVWYEEYLSDEEMNILYKSADFFLLPSAQLHSMSILKSMYCGAIPVVSDTVGTNQYVRHMENGIILKGVKDAVFRDKVSLLKADIKNYLLLEDDLSEQLFKNLDSIIKNKDAISFMKALARDSVVQNYISNESSSEIFEYVLNRYVINKKNIRKYKNRGLVSLISKILKRFILDSDFSAYKQITKQKIFEWEKLKVFKHYRRYYITKKERFFENIADFPKPYSNILNVKKEITKRLDKCNLKKKK